ncbi:MAG: hypothetical protein ACRC8S_11170 [Fimbriiglobus sp.]
MFKKSRKWLLAVAVVGLVVVGLLVWLSVNWNRPGVTAAKIKAIRTGMTYAEVEKLMGYPSGLPPTEIAVGSVTITRPPESFVLAHLGRGHDWIGYDAAALVIFDKAGRVEQVIPYEVGFIPPKSKPWWKFW